MTNFSLYLLSKSEIVLVIISPFDKFLGISRLPFDKPVEELLRFHFVSSLIDAQAFRYSHKSIDAGVIFYSNLSHVSSIAAGVAISTSAGTSLFTHISKNFPNSRIVVIPLGTNAGRIAVVESGQDESRNNGIGRRNR